MPTSCPTADRKQCASINNPIKRDVVRISIAIARYFLHNATMRGQRANGVAGTPPLSGRLTTITGCMFSGKTTELLKRLGNVGAAHVAAFKHASDTRYQADSIVTHGGKAFPAKLARRVGDMADPLPNAAHMVGIDEAHFFCAGLIRVVSSMTKAGVHVLVTALNVDSWGNPFPVVQQLMDMATESVVLDATCSQCGGIAIRTQRLTPIVDGNMIGGAEAYQPRCLPCWTPPPILAEQALAVSPTNLQPAAY